MFIFIFALVVQRIRHRSTEPGMGVRFPPGAPLKTLEISWFQDLTMNTIDAMINT